MLLNMLLEVFQLTYRIIGGSVDGPFDHTLVRTPAFVKLEPIIGSVLFTVY